MKKSRFLTRRLSIAAAAACLVTGLGSAAGAAALDWYDGFKIDDANPASTTNYVSGVLAHAAVAAVPAVPATPGDPNATPPIPANPGSPAVPAMPAINQDGGAGTFFTGTWSADSDDNVLAPGSLSRKFQSMPSTGDKVSDQPAAGCCNTSRSERKFAAPFVGLNKTIYMSFLVDFGGGNPADPHYHAVEFWNGGFGDSALTMSLGFSSFGNYNDPQNDADGPKPTPDTTPPNVTANTQLSAKVVGIRSLFGPSVGLNYQFGEHLEWNQQIKQTHEIVIKYDLTTDDVELGGVGDKVSFFLDPKLTDVNEPTPSLVVSGVDLNMDGMSAGVLFNFTMTDPTDPGAMDELRVGSTWKDVANLSAVPEPASLSLLGLGAIGLLLAARRKRV